MPDNKKTKEEKGPFGLQLQVRVHHWGESPQELREAKYKAPTIVKSWEKQMYCVACLLSC